MSVENYIKRVSEKGLSEVKQIILQTLWGDGTVFPSEWIASSYLLEITQQKYFDRRTRELRDQHGCDIETKYINGEHHYRLCSEVLKAANPRLYLSASEKKRLFARENYTCQICGIKTDPGLRGIQADHKMPLSRGGTHKFDNWQSLCNECNVAKRRACQKCEEDCSSCSWAFPAIEGIPLVVRLPKEAFDYVTEKSHLEPKWLEKLVLDEISRSE
jgi:5-methylcytosine-specific restriction endonuclease McrA